MNEDSTEYDKPSKSQLKREAEQITHLARQLVQLDNESLNKLKLSESILHAITEYKKIKSNNALKRQLHYLSKLLRTDDTEELHDKLESLSSAARQNNEHFKYLEHLREQLLKDDQSLTEIISNHPQIDPQHIRQLIRTARKEYKLNKPPAASRTLFRYLRDTIQND